MEIMKFNEYLNEFSIKNGNFSNEYFIIFFQ